MEGGTGVSAARHVRAGARKPRRTRMLTPRAFQGAKLKRAADHLTSISSSLNWIVSSLSAESVTSTTSSAFSTSGASSSCCRRNSASVTGSLCPVIFSTASQWRGMIDALESSESCGSTSWKSSIFFFSAVYASQSRRRLGIFLQRDANDSASCVMVATFAAKSGHRIFCHSSILAITSR